MRTNRHRVAVVALALALAVVGLALTLPGAGASLKASKATKAQIEKTCSRVADVLSDGPDPDVDPVGYALAQVHPLRQISTSDPTLKTDIDNLASAFENVYKTNDKKGAQAVVTKAGNKLDTICPGAF